MLVLQVTDKEFLILLGNRIRLLRKSKEMSQLDLGIAMNNYAEQIGRIERGELNVTICTLKKVCEALNISLSEFFMFDQ